MRAGSVALYCSLCCGRRDKVRALRSTRSSSGPFGVAVIGAGRLGGALALALGRRGYEIRAIVSREAGSAREISKVLGSHAPGSSGSKQRGKRGPATAAALPLALNIKQLHDIPPVDCLLVCTPDDVIEEVAGNVARSLMWSAHQGTRSFAFHTSGALPSSILNPLRSCGFLIGSFHPLVSVTGVEMGAASLKGAFFCLEGDRPAVSAARRIVADFEGRAFQIRAGKKPLYHAAAVMAAGHVVALFDIATKMLTKAGVKRQEAREMFLPLLRSTLANVIAQGTAPALTGTFARRDVKTVERHLIALKEHGSFEELTLYLLLGKHSLSLTEHKGAHDKITRIIQSLLDDALEQVMAEWKAGQ